MSMRGLDPPFERIAEPWERITARSEAQTEALFTDKKRLAAAEARVEAQLQEFRALQKHKH
jgi:hypothetical protein